MKRFTSQVLAFLVSLSALVPVCPPACAAGQSPTPAGLADGAGVWANIWNYPAGDLDAYCANLSDNGVRNLFIQTTRINMPPLAHEVELGQVIEACHRHKIRVIGWAYLELVDPAYDADKMLAAAHYRSPRGEALDAVAPDLEKNLSVGKVETFSHRLREELGTNYPLIAVVYSPLNHYHEVAQIPWGTLGRYYNVLAPMAYWKKQDCYDYTLATVRLIREQCGRPDLEIHVIGDGMGTSGTDITRFMKACRRAEATSASIYPNQKPTADQLASLAHYGDFFEANGRFRLAAFRQMMRSGALPENQKVDPTQAVSRADFYHLVSSYLHVNMLPIPATAGGDMPIDSNEAISVLAALVDKAPAHGNPKGKRPDRWFSAPATAATLHNSDGNGHELNWLDACQMVLQTSSALR